MRSSRRSARTLGNVSLLQRCHHPRIASASDSPLQLRLSRQDSPLEWGWRGLANSCDARYRACKKTRLMFALGSGTHIWSCLAPRSANPLQTACFLCRSRVLFSPSRRPPALWPVASSRTRCITGLGQPAPGRRERLPAGGCTHACATVWQRILASLRPLPICTQHEGGGGKFTAAGAGGRAPGRTTPAAPLAGRAELRGILPHATMFYGSPDTYLFYDAHGTAHEARHDVAPWRTRAPGRSGSWVPRAQIWQHPGLFATAKNSCGPRRHAGKAAVSWGDGPESRVNKRDGCFAVGWQGNVRVLLKQTVLIEQSLCQLIRHERAVQLPIGLPSRRVPCCEVGRPASCPAWVRGVAAPEVHSNLRMPGKGLAEDVELVRRMFRWACDVDVVEERIKPLSGEPCSHFCQCCILPLCEYARASKLLKATLFLAFSLV